MIYNSRNSQYFQRNVPVCQFSANLQQQKFLVLPKGVSRVFTKGIYNSRNSQYFQRFFICSSICRSTTVEILSTSKGSVELNMIDLSTTVEILSTSKGQEDKDTSIYLQQQKFLVLPKAYAHCPPNLIYNSRNSQYFQRPSLIIFVSSHLQQQKFLVLPKDIQKMPLH